MLGQPIRPLARLGLVALPLALLVSFVAQVITLGYSAVIVGACLGVVIASVVLFTPYLLLACGCFYAISRLPFPKSGDPRAWWMQMALLLAAIFFLWRTWRLWPSDMPKTTPLSAGARKAPWWALGLGLFAIGGIVGYMAYVFFFQQ